MKPFATARLHPWPSGEDPERVREVTVRRYTDDQVEDACDEVAAEEPLEIRVAGQSLAVIMRTPGHDAFLAAGFLLSEGIIARADDVLSIGPGLDRDGFPEPNALEVRLRPDIEVSVGLRRREFYVSSSCGICGAASVEAVRSRINPRPFDATVSADVILGLESTLRDYQAVFARTGGLHAAGLFDAQGSLLELHEDVGRHNAVDKVIGQMLLQRRLPLDRCILMVSGRASFELLQKAAIAGVPVFVAVGAPSSLAIEMATASNVTLIGLLRKARFIVYSWPERIRHAD